jgi:hypothetical protein
MSSAPVPPEGSTAKANRQRIRALALDLDGTILDADRRISARSVAAVAAFRKSGREVLVATGRARPAALPWVRHLGGVSGLVCQNGATVYDGEAANQTVGDPFEQRMIPETAARRLVALSRSFGMHFHAFRGESWHYERVVAETAAYQKRAGFPGTLSDFDQFTELRFTKAMFVGADLGRAASAVNEACDGEVSVFLSGPDYLEIVARGVSKAAGLQAWLSRRGWVPGDVMAFGDAENDEEMLLQAGIGVAMGNAPDALKKRIGRVTGSLEEDGAAAYIEAFLAQESSGTASAG